MSKIIISPAVLEVIERSTIDATSVSLPSVPRLDHKLYEQVNKVLEAAGGQWNRKLQRHVFTIDPRVKLGLAQESGVIIDEVKARKKERQAFYTPEQTAGHVAALADVTGHIVLEPSAGHGALALACANLKALVECVELDAEACEHLTKLNFAVRHRGDFLSFFPSSPVEEYCRIVMNPPFTRKADARHVLHAYQHWLKGGGYGLLTAIVADDGQDRPDIAEISPESYRVVERLPAGTFREAGTNIATLVIQILKTEIQSQRQTQAKTMIKDTDSPAPTAAASGTPLMTPGHTFKQNGRTMVVVNVARGAGHGAEGDIAWVEVVHSIDPKLIDPHPKNRTWCDKQALQVLIENMREHGQSTPGIVRPHPTQPGRYELVAGWRRSTACRELKRSFQCMVRELDDVQALEQLYIENAQRENLRPLDEAELIDGMLELRDAQGQRLFTLERVALARYGKASSNDLARVSKIHKLRLLPEALHGPVNEGTLPLQVAYLVARIADPADREKAGAEVLKDPQDYSGQRPVMSVKRAAEHIASKYQVNLKGWKEMERTDLLSEEERLNMGFTGAQGEAADGSCERCPFLARNNPLFADGLAVGRGKKGSGESGIDPLTCTRAACHRMKLENGWKQRAAVFARKHGLTEAEVLPLNDESRWRFKELDKKPNAQALKEWDMHKDPKLPTLATMLKGSEGLIRVAPDDDDQPELVCDHDQAVAYARTQPAHEHWFKQVAADEAQGIHLSSAEVKDLKARQETGELKAGEAELLAQIAEREEKKRLAELEAEMERAIGRETHDDALRELQAKLSDQGPGLAGAQALLIAVCRSVDAGADLLAFFTGRDEQEIEDECNYDYEPLVRELAKDRTLNELMAMASIAAVWDDIGYSGFDRATDFKALCEAAGVDLDGIHKRVKKAHELAFRAKEKARTEALQAEAQGGTATGSGKGKRKGKKAAGNSSDPVKVDAEHEASKSAAADAIAKDDRVVLREYSSVDEMAEMMEALLTHEVPVTVPNEHGIFVQRASFVLSLAPTKIGFGIDLALGADGRWSWGYDFQIGDKSGGGNPSADESFATRAAAVFAAVTAVCKVWRAMPATGVLMAPHEAVRAMLSNMLDESMDAVGATTQAMSAPAAVVPEAQEPAAAAPIDLDAVDVDTAAKAVMTDGKHYTDFIGPKPHKNNDRERFKKWDALRDKIQRRAGNK